MKNQSKRIFTTAQLEPVGLKHPNLSRDRQAVSRHDVLKTLIIL